LIGSSPPSYTCDGCGEPAATETLWLNAPLGLTAVHVHRTRECAQAARERRGGGRFRPEPGTETGEQLRLGREPGIMDG
jgi:hypothetical protein